MPDAVFMRAMFLRTIVTSVAFATLFAGSASAQTPPVIQPLLPCYVVAQESQREPLSVVASGFTPFSKVAVLLDDILQYEATATVTGEIRGMVPAPNQESGTRGFQLRLAQNETPLNTVTANSLVTRLSVQQSPRRAATSDRVRFKGRGFKDLSKPVYAHYIFAGRSRKTVSLGLPKGPCGTFNARRQQFPFKKSPAVGTWTIQFDQLPYYDPKAGVRVPMTIKVTKRASARAR
jgi:hypothetical protein